eukprot:2230164-Amphidinium_carterae.1
MEHVGRKVYDACVGALQFKCALCETVVVGTIELLGDLGLLECPCLKDVVVCAKLNPTLYGSVAEALGPS